MSFLLSSFSGVLLAEVPVVSGGGFLSNKVFIFDGANRNMPDYSPPPRETFLVQDTFTGTKAQLKPIADFFLSQPWYYWVGQDLAGQRTKSFDIIFGYSAGDVWHSERAHTGSMNSIKGLTDASGKALGSDARIMDILNSPQVQPDLLKAVQESFPDINGDEWYASMVGLAVMMGIIGGKPGPDGEGLIFAGDDYLTRAEWIAMLNRCRGYEDWLRLMNAPGANNPSSDGVVPSGTWFLADYNHSMAVSFGGMYTLAELSQPATRAEAAMLLECGAGFRLKAEKHGYPVYSHELIISLRNQFTDTVDMWVEPQMSDALKLGYLVPVTSMRPYLDEMTIPQRLTAAKNRTLDFPYSIYAHLMGNVNARVFGGFPDGTLRPYDPLTRAQALAILFKLYDMYPDSIFADSYDW